MIIQIIGWFCIFWFIIQTLILWSVDVPNDKRPLMTIASALFLIAAAICFK